MDSPVERTDEERERFWEQLGVEPPNFVYTKVFATSEEMSDWLRLQADRGKGELEILLDELEKAYAKQTDVALLPALRRAIARVEAARG